MPNQAIKDFSLQGTGGPFKLSALKNKFLIVYFYPKDNTPGCTTEGQQFRDLYADFKKAGCEIIGISRDSLKSHINFKAKQAFPFELLADEEELACNQFAVMKMKNMYGKQVRGIERSTFLLDAHHAIVREWRGVKVPGHVTEVLDFVKTL